MRFVMDKNMNDLFLSELNDMLSAENQIVKALPKAISAADSPDLKEALANHLEETKNQVERLKEIFNYMNAQPSSEECLAMQGLIKEAEEVVSKFSTSHLRDAALIAKLQRVEHYEIAAYGVLRTFAKQMELRSEIPSLLKESLDEESNADKKLTKIAEGGWFTAGINQKASRDY